jgi:hypothetical protein
MKLNKIVALPIGVAIEAISYVCLFLLVILGSPFLIGRWAKRAIFGIEPKAQVPLVVENEGGKHRSELVAQAQTKLQEYSWHSK